MNYLQYQIDETNQGHSWLPIASDGLDSPIGAHEAMGPSWDNMTILRPSDAIEGHRGPCMTQISFVYLVSNAFFCRLDKFFSG